MSDKTTAEVIPLPGAATRASMARFEEALLRIAAPQFGPKAIKARVWQCWLDCNKPSAEPPGTLPAPDPDHPEASLDV